MKRTILSTWLCFVVFGTLNLFSHSSLVLTAEHNYFQADNELIKQQVVFVDPGSNGKNLLWDFRTLQPINEDYSLKYFIPDSTYMNHICGMEHRTRYYYNQKRDSVWATGYENYTTFMEYNTPELKMKYPFTYGDTLYSNFEGKGEYGRRLNLHVKGYTRIHADAEGELILPNNETVRKALRVHTQRQYTETGSDSTQMTLDTYTWYAAGMRYPVFESIKTSIQRTNKTAGNNNNSTPNSNNTTLQDTTVFATSFYYSPEEQTLQVGANENELNIINQPEGAAAVFTEATLFPNPVSTNLYIDYKLTRDAKIWFSIHNNLGLAQCSTFPQQQSEGYNTTAINMSYLIQGVYTLHVHVDDMIMILNVVKK